MQLALAVAIDKPQRSSRTLHQIGQGLDDRLPEVEAAVCRRQRLGEAQPFGAVVVAVGKEMLADEDAQAGAHRPREQQRPEQHKACEEQRHLQRPPPVATEVAHVIGGTGDHQQIEPRPGQRGRMEHHLARHRHAQGPRRAARSGNRDQRDQQRMGDTPCRQDVGVEAREQQGIGEQVEFEDVSRRKCEAERLEPPTRDGGHAPVELLDEHQPHDRMR